MALGGDHPRRLPRSRDAPPVLAVGDIHLENFGTWTDKEGRIVWGVNDYDEAAEMPYILDLVRLATSAALAATPSQLSLKAIYTNLLEGYEQGLEAPEAFVLDRQHMWLRTRFVVSEAERAMFWQKIDSQYHALLAKKNPEQPPARWLKLFAGALPDPSITLSYWRHTAGTGSLGRPRWLGAMAPGVAARCYARARRWCRPAGHARMPTARGCVSTTLR